jgi:YfiH family protein
VSTSFELGFPVDWPSAPGVRAWQTTRVGGLGAGPYQSLNLAGHVDDDPDVVAANRERLRSGLALPSEPVWLEQVHGVRILKPDRGEASGAADGAVSFRPGTVLAVMTADCLPVLLTTRAGDVVAAVHAGWRGLAHGVIAAGVEALERQPTDVMAWLGPAIGPDAFEVGDEVREAFVRRSQDSAQAFVGNERGRWQADLYALARLELERHGVTRIFGGGSCTHRDSERFFSHRREAPCGRMATLIWREAPASS